MPRILAVDDSPDQLLALELHLRGGGFEVETALDGMQALERCKEVEFDLILLDVRMPGIDGFEVSRRLKGSHRSAFTPVIFLSGNLPSESARREACELGPVDFVQKPFDREELVARIQLMLRLQDVRRRLVVENARIGRELDTTQRALAEAREQLADLWALHAHDELSQAGLALVGADLCIAGVDRRARDLWPELARGARLDVLGPDGERVAALARARAGECQIQGDRVQCAVDDLGGDGWVALRLCDARAGTALKERIIAREQAGSAEPAADVRTRGYRITEYVGESGAVREVATMVDRLRRGRSTVLIHGETGTGKEIVARALHYDGPAPSRPFIPIHCGAITRDLIESELFGFEKGAFTGAQQSHDGLFGAADGGTIFLDEIAETSLELQVKLLRVLQRGEIRRVGSTQHRLVDVRIVAATHRDLRRLVQEGRFREDLFHRLDVVTLHLPPLRERRDDLPALIDHFLRRGNERFQRGDRPVRGVSRAAMQRLLAHDWPGNVRELENVIERVFALGVGELVQEEDLPTVLRGGEAEPRGRAPRPRPAPTAVEPLPTVVLPAQPPVPRSKVLDLRARRQDAERSAFEQALAAANGDKRTAAQTLGLPRSTFYRRLRELGL